MNIYIVLSILGITALIIFKRSGSFFKALLTSALGGIGSLCAVGALSYFVPLTLGINAVSLFIAALYSVPGVIMLLLVKTFVF